jgi:hypothetical protein
VAVFPGLAKNGLIKIKSNIVSGAADIISEFCKHFGICVLLRVTNFADVNSVCAGRTLLKDNAYLKEVLPTAYFDEAMKFAVMALTSSYYKEYLPEGSSSATSSLHSQFWDMVTPSPRS